MKKLSRKILVLVLFILAIIYPLDKNNERGGIDNCIDHPQMSRHDYLWSYQLISSDENYFHDSAISSDGNYSVVGTGKSSNPIFGRVYLFHKSNPTPLWNYSINYGVYSVAISADGSYIVAGGGNSYLYLFHKSDSTPLWNFSGPTAAVRSVAISADGNYIVASARGATDRSTIWLFHRSSSTPQWSYTYIGPDGTYLADISADGNYVIGGFAYGLSFFERSNPTPLWSYSTGLESGGGERVQSIAISANGDFITMGSKNNKIYSFHKSNSSPLWKYNTTVISTICVDISSDGKFISAGIQNGMFYIFNTTNNFPIFRYRAKSFIPYEDGTTMVEFSTPSFCILGFYGKLYSFNSTDNWDMVQVSELYEFNQAIQTTAISSNSDYIIVGIKKVSLYEKNHVYLFGNFYRNILPSSNHPDDLIIKEGLMNSTITWKLYDDLGSDPFCQSFTINYSRLIEKDGIKYYEFTFKTNKYYDDDYLMLCNNNQVNSIFYESFQIEYFEQKDLINIVIDYLSEDLYEIDYLNNSIIMPNASQNPITQINNIKDFNLVFRINDLYRVKRSEENGSNLIWVNWDQWYSDNNVLISVDSSKSGIYNYTIEYFDNNLQFGISDSVIVIIEEASDEGGSQSTNFSISSFNLIIFFISGVLVSVYLFYSVKKSEKGANYFN